MRPKAVFLDVDNTLLDFNAGALQTIQSGFAAFGLAYSDEVYAAFLRINAMLWRRLEDGALTRRELYADRWNLIFADCGVQANGPAFETWFRQGIADSAAPVSGAAALLRYLKGKYTVCIASNASYRQQVGRLKKADMLACVDRIFISEQIGFPKPQRAFFEACAAGAGVSAQDALMIGDSYEADILGANACGWRTCWYNPTLAPAPGAFTPDITVRRLEDIKAYI